MSENVYIFKRVEKKYFLNPAQRDEIIRAFGDKMLPDTHGESTICSLYLDTPDYRIIRASIDAVNYKEKLRIRSYGTPENSNEKVFFEIKKKLDGVVYKRRVQLPLSDVLQYIKDGKKTVQSQIMNEIDYFMRFYDHPVPRMLIAYDRTAFFSPSLQNFRITFDTNVRYRGDNLDLCLGTHGTPLTDKDFVIMEIKTDGAMPLWMSKILDTQKIYPSRYSKYAKAYLKNQFLKGEINYE